MSISVAETIRSVGFTRLHKASGIPMRTLFRWAADDKLPGKTDLQLAVRERMFAEAVEKAGGEIVPRPAPKAKRRAACL